MEQKYIDKLRNRFGSINPYDRPEYFTKKMHNPSARFPDEEEEIIKTMKYFIEHLETEYWLTFNGALIIKVLNDCPDLECWTKNPNKAFGFSNKQNAQNFLDYAIKNKLLTDKIVVTEHEFN